jgi:hypothetical protein
MERLGFNRDFFEVKKNGCSPFQTMLTYLGGSVFQTVMDNPATAYRQMIQQYAKDLNGKTVDPKIARMETNAIFKRAPIGASLSGLGPRLIGIGFKRVPAIGVLLGISYTLGEEGEVSIIAATGASIISAIYINPIRMIEKQQRAYYKQTGAFKPTMTILREAAAKQYRPLFRGTTPLIGHSVVSATTGFAGQPQLERYIRTELNMKTSLGAFATGLLASTIVSPIYIIMTNPLSRLEVIMQTSSIKGKSIGLLEACKEIALDSKTYGLRGIFRGQGVGIVKAIISLTMFHQGRIYCTEGFKGYNEQNGNIPK